ncbi:MAG: DNA internalization-related competence protein ComEC/Rec2 [Clostridiales bacterium]|nr:DNA internalization-related competence protein ComEC/Rec2 [Clostridiales bacterium]
MIRRPMLYIAVTFASSILIFHYFGKVAAFAALVALLCCYFFAGKHECRGESAIGIIAICYLMGILNIWFYSQGEDPLLQMEEQTAAVGGEVKTCQKLYNSRGEEYLKYKVKIDCINEIKVSGKNMLLSWDYSSAGIEPGDKVMLRGHIELPEERRNPRCFNYRLYLESVGIRAVMKGANVEIVKKGRGIESLLYQAKEKFRHRMGEVAGRDTAELLQGIMFGDETGIEKETLEEFRKNGTAHILAVSGLHIGIIYGFISLLWFGKKKWLFFLLVSGFFAVYTIMAEFAPSVVRAVFMVELHSFAKLTNRRYDLSTAAFAVASAMMVYNPMQIFHVGFQMSFIAVLSLSLLLPYIKKIHNGILAGGLAIQAGMTPLTIFIFNYISVVGIFINIFVIFLAGVIVPLGLVAFLFSEISSLFFIASRILFYLCVILEESNHLTCIDSITVYDVASPPVSLIAFYYLCLLVLLSEEGRLMFIRKERRKVAVSIICMVFVSFAFGLACRSGFENADLIFVDVGQGDCIHFKIEEGGDYMVDGGGSFDYDVGKKTLKPYLLKNGVRELEGAFVTHLHTDHYEGIARLCREGMVRRLFLYEGCRASEEKILNDTGLKKDEITYIFSGEKINLGKSAFVEVLWPRRGSNTDYEERMSRERDENESCLILKVTIQGVSVLITGDVDESCQAELAGIWGNTLKTDILKVAHHGSKCSYSEEFNEKALPKYAVFQVGKNNYGHPNQEVVDRYEARGAVILRNDMNGAIGFETGKRIVKKITMLSP